jgi:uncharacterized protein YdeI (BOF family)
MEPTRVEGTLPPGRRPEPRRAGGLWAIVAIVAAVIAGIWIWSAYNDRQRGGAVANLDEVIADPAEHVGERVTVTGSVESQLAPQSFTLKDRDGTGEILVVNRTGAMLTLSENAQVQVSGEVRVFDLAELESDVGYDLDDALFQPWEGKAVLLANTVNPVGGADVVPEEPREGAPHQPDEPARTPQQSPGTEYPPPPP